MTFKYRLSSWVLCALAARIYGADPTGAISGIVLDPSGAPIAKVRITATNTGASFNRETLSAVDGRFVFPLRPVGPYALAMEAPGFRRFEQRGITVSANVNVTIPVVLQVGETTENGKGGSARGPARNAFRHTGTGGESAEDYRAAAERPECSDACTALAGDGRSDCRPIDALKTKWQLGNLP